MTQKLLIPLVMLSLVACNSAPKRDPDYAPVAAAALPPAPASNGAIFQSGYEKSWFEDLRARRIGDILTVTLKESINGEHTNEGSVEKSNTTSITNPTLLGNPLNFAVPGASADGNLGFNLNSSSKFDGDGENTQKSELTGSVTVMVIDVLSNGYLKVRGEKRIGLTGGNEYIKLSGIVRPSDIDTSNTVPSTKIGDATLIYKGDGQVSEASVMGWFARFFITAFSPF